MSKEKRKERNAGGEDGISSRNKNQTEATNNSARRYTDEILSRLYETPDDQKPGDKQDFSGRNEGEKERNEDLFSFSDTSSAQNKSKKEEKDLRAKTESVKTRQPHENETVNR